MVGLNQKDDHADNARRFLGRLRQSVRGGGRRSGNGRVSIEWGVYGVPESFIIGRDGKIAFKLVGPLTPDNLEQVIKPELEKALAAK